MKRVISLRLLCWLALGLLIETVSTLTCAAGIPTEPTFVSIGYLNEPSPQISISGLSGDGTTLVGTSYGTRNQAVRWTWDAGLQFLPTNLPDGQASADAVSNDGRTIAGLFLEENTGGGPYTNFDLLTWTDGVFTNRGSLPDDLRFSPVGLSGDGTTVLGATVAGVHRYGALVWPVGGEPTYLPDGGPTGSMAKASSFDGSVIVGTGDPLSDSNGFAFRWSESTGLVDLGRIPGPVQPFEIFSGNDVSDDGNTIVGHALLGANAASIRQRAFTWTAESGMQLLELPDPAVFDTVAAAISPDGDVAVGYLRNFETFEQHAVMWDAAHGMRDVQEVLAKSGVDMTGWQLTLALGVSDGGRVMYGYGENPEGRDVTWVAVMPAVPEPNAVSLALVGVAALALRVKRCRGG